MIQNIPRALAVGVSVLLKGDAMAVVKENQIWYNMSQRFQNEI